MTTRRLTLTSFQQRVLAIPEQHNLCIPGGRGGGKTYAVCLLLLRFAEQYREKARALVVRRSYKGLEDLMSTLLQLMTNAHGATFRYHSTEHVLKLANGAYIEGFPLQSEGDLMKVHGREFPFVVVDEAAQCAHPSLLDQLRGSMRGLEGTPVRMVYTANPGGVGHAWLTQRLIFRAPEPWTPFEEKQTRQSWVLCPSTFRDNPHIDADAYEAQMRAACGSDPELLKAWLSGDFRVARGAYLKSRQSRVTSPKRLDPVYPATSRKTLLRCGLEVVAVAGLEPAT